MSNINKALNVKKSKMNLNSIEHNLTILTTLLRYARNRGNTKKPQNY